MIIKILLALVVLVAAILILAAFQPSTFAIERAVTISAPATALYPRINDLHQLHEWSPWKEKDLQCSYTFEGPPAGVGASQAWSGNSEVGSGKQTIIESRPGELVRLRVEFYKPIEGICESTYTLSPAADGTRVSWKMTGANNYLGKVFCLFMNQDKMIGTEFEKGLAKLKASAETAAAHAH